MGAIYAHEPGSLLPVNSQDAERVMVPGFQNLLQLRVNGGCFCGRDGLNSHRAVEHTLLKIGWVETFKFQTIANAKVTRETIREERDNHDI